MRLLRRHRHLVVWLAAIAIVGNALAMAVVAPSKAVALVDDILGPISLCVGDHAKTAPGDGSGGGGRSQVHHCVACVHVAQFVLAVASAMGVLAFPPRSNDRPVW